MVLGGELLVDGEESQLDRFRSLGWHDMHRFRFGLGVYWYITGASDVIITALIQRKVHTRLDPD